jgi:hypothetical protein
LVRSVSASKSSHIIVVADLTGGNAEDIGETCELSDSMVTDAELSVEFIALILGVTGGIPEALETFPINHD